MKLTQSISFRNMTRKPARTVALAVIAALLAFTVFGGTMVVDSLRSGLDSLEARLGADIMVVPYKAATQQDLQNMVLEGNPGYFYMDSSLVDQIAQTEGIEQLSTQFFLASAKAGCCSFPVQIIGFDPQTDFTVKPWIKDSYGGELGHLDVVVGYDINAFVGDQIMFYGTVVNVVGKLDDTGTTLDTAVYANNETVKTLIRSAYDNKFENFSFNPDTVVSCVLINVAEGYTVEDVLNDINLHVRAVEAVQTASMTSGVSKSIIGVSDAIATLIAVVWVLAIAILVISFSMIMNERKKEFAVLRVIGASRKKLARIILGEAAMISFLGAIIGIAAGIVVVFPFGNFIEGQLGLPFLAPGAGTTIGLALLALVITVVAGSLTASFKARRISQEDSSLILRGDN